MTVLILAHCRVRQGTRDAFIARFEAFRETIAAHEPGTLCFDLYAACAEDDCFLIEERFADEAAREAHFAAPYYRPSVDGLREFIVAGDHALYSEREV